MYIITNKRKSELRKIAKVYAGNLLLTTSENGQYSELVSQEEMNILLEEVYKIGSKLCNNNKLNTLDDCINTIQQ